MEAPERKLTVAFTGHRPDKLGGYGRVNPMRDNIVRAILAKLRGLRPTHAISGMSLGVDQWAASACFYLGIPFTAAVPFAGQESLWDVSSQIIYHGILSKAAEVEIINTSQVDVSVALQRRNEWMVDNSDLLIAVWNGSPGGTANTVKYAKLMDKPVFYIDPRQFED